MTQNIDRQQLSALGALPAETPLTQSKRILREALGMDTADGNELLYLAGAAAQLITMLRASLEAGRAETGRLTVELDALRAEACGSVWYARGIDGMETFATADEARTAATELLSRARDDAYGSEWPEDTESIDYGRLYVVEAARVIERGVLPGGGQWSEYGLADPQTWTDPPANGRCRVCGCTDFDCRHCIERTGEPCKWADEERTLCSACMKVTP